MGVDLSLHTSLPPILLSFSRSLSPFRNIRHWLILLTFSFFKKNFLFLLLPNHNLYSASSVIRSYIYTPTININETTTASSNQISSWGLSQPFSYPYPYPRPSASFLFCGQASSFLPLLLLSHPPPSPLETLSRSQRRSLWDAQSLVRLRWLLYVLWILNPLYYLNNDTWMKNDGPHVFLWALLSVPVPLYKVDGFDWLISFGWYMTWSPNISDALHNAGAKGTFFFSAFSFHFSKHMPSFWTNLLN